MLEFKNINAEVKDVDASTMTVTGYLSKFGNEDSHKDIVHKGAFSKSISERKDSIYFLYNHDWNKILQKGYDVLKEDSYGLYFESKIVPTSFGLDTIKLYEAGVLSQHSIGYETVKFQRKSNGGRHLRELKLWEGTVTPIASNSGASFLGLKALTLTEVKDQTSKIMDLLKKGTLTDDTFIQLELALKMLQTKSFELGKQHSKKTEEPTAVTPKNYEPLLNKLSNFKL